MWEITASVIEWETEPGTVLEAYAYNGTVPGPQLRAEVGDRVRIVLHNELPVPTTIHSHGLIVPNAMDGVPVISQPAVMPGESFTYEFTLRNAGSHMYHSHFMADHQVPMGLLGAFVVTDPTAADEPVADIDYAMVLNDGPRLHPQRQGLPGHRADRRHPGPDHPGSLHERRTTDSPDASAWPTAAGHRQGRLPPARSTLRGHRAGGPGERIDVLIEATELGIWAYHCRHPDPRRKFGRNVRDGDALIVNEP